MNKKKEYESRGLSLWTWLHVIGCVLAGLVGWSIHQSVPLTFMDCFFSWFFIVQHFLGWWAVAVYFLALLLVDVLVELGKSK